MSGIQGHKLYQFQPAAVALADKHLHKQPTAAAAPVDYDLPQLLSWLIRWHADRLPHLQPSRSCVMDLNAAMRGAADAHQ